MRRRAFSLIELIVAIALLAMIIAIAGVIFRIALSSYRLAGAHAEIMSKLRLLTHQIDNDFTGLQTDAPVFLGWVAQEDPNQKDGYTSLDRIVFFSQGRAPYRALGNTPAPIKEGSLARISYMLANVNEEAPEDQSAAQRILARTQHIMAPTNGLEPTISAPNDLTEWAHWHNDRDRQYDDRYFRSQLWLALDPNDLQEAMTGMSGMEPDSRDIQSEYGTWIDMNDPGESLHKILCQGVGQFRIQGWYEQVGVEARWVPDPHWDLLDSAVADQQSGSLLYPSNPDGNASQSPYGFVHLGGRTFIGEEYHALLNPVGWRQVPGLGRALRFTFTLYDSQGLIENGLTFTHIVYLDR